MASVLTPLGRRDQPTAEHPPQGRGPPFGPGPRGALPEPSGDLWGFLCRIRGGEAQYDLPPGFKVSAASEQIFRYLQRVGGELARLPHRYGYDPATAYAAYVQTWDCALEPFPSLAFGRQRDGHEAVGLIPDVYYTNADGYGDLHLHGLRTPPWRVRSPDVVWRGSVTGRGAFAEPLDIPRVKLARLCRDLEGTNVALVGVHDTMHFPREPLEAFLKREDLLADWWWVHDFAYYRFAIDIDGHANAWGLIEKLILGCCVLKVASPFEQWFYPRMHPFEHYVPVSADLSDLGDALQWRRENDAQCEWIAANGARLARALRSQAVLEDSCRTFMRVAAAGPA